MSGLAEVLASARAAGVQLALDGADLDLQAAAPPPPNVLALLRGHKPEIIAWLRQVAPLRAALDHIIEAGALVGMPDRRWQQFQADADAFLRDFGASAAALGWGADDLFGFDSAAPRQRIDKLGLVWLLDGRTVIMIDESAARFRAAGSVLTFYRKRGEPK